MLLKLFTVFSLIFVLIITIVFGSQLYALANQIATKNPSSIHNILRKKEPDFVSRIYVNDNFIDVDVVSTPQERAKGLMDREYLERNKGMLFIFPREGVYYFWMKNMNFPIDMIWINKDLRVVYFEENVPPCLELVCPKYGSEQKAQYVLETPAGWAKRNSIINGTKLSFY